MFSSKIPSSTHMARQRCFFLAQEIAGNPQELRVDWGCSGRMGKAHEAFSDPKIHRINIRIPWILTFLKKNNFAGVFKSRAPKDSRTRQNWFFPRRVLFEQFCIHQAKSHFLISCGSSNLLQESIWGRFSQMKWKKKELWGSLSAFKAIF